MGIEYTLVCDAMREYVDPHAIDGQLGKDGQILSGGSRFGQLTLYLMVSRWSGQRVRLVGEWDSYSSKYRDVGLEAIRAFNAEWGEYFIPIEARAGYGAAEDEDEEGEPLSPADRREVRLAYRGTVLAQSFARDDSLAGLALAPTRAMLVSRPGGEDAAIALEDVEPSRLSDFVLEEVADATRGSLADLLIVAVTRDVDGESLGRDSVLETGRRLREPIAVALDSLRVANRRDRDVEFWFELRGTASVAPEPQS